MSKPIHISLIGPRYSGKSAIGTAFSEKTKIEFIDSDLLFQSQHQASISDYIGSQGWEKFREMESKLVTEVIHSYTNESIIFATGGGAVANNESLIYSSNNKANLREFGKVFYLIPFENNLELNAQILTERSFKFKNSITQHRPNLTTLPQYEEIKKTLQERDPAYRLAAHHIVYTGTSSIETIVTQIQALWHLPLNLGKK
jgi:shikimate kinase